MFFPADPPIARNSDELLPDNFGPESNQIAYAPTVFPGLPQSAHQPEGSRLTINS